MIPVRSLAEAAVYARATGAAPFERVSMSPTEQLWRCWWRDERRDLRFVLRPSPGSSALLDPDAFLEVSRALLREIPPVIPEIPRGEARRIVEDCTLAVYALDEAARDPSFVDAKARTHAVALRSAWTGRLSAGPPLPADPSVAAPLAPPEAPPLLEVQRARLRATLLPGLAADVALARLLAPGERASLLGARRVDGTTVRFLTIDLLDPARSALLLLMSDDVGTVTGHRVVDGADGRVLRGAVG